MSPASPFSRRIAVLGFACLTLFSACKKTPEAAKDAAGAATPLAVVLQTDWYAQAEHGGFYQGVAAGLYKARGLDVTIQQGGPGGFPAQKVATGQAHFAIGRSDDIMIAVQQGLPLVIVAAQMQHDPQGILVHDESPVRRFEDLNGKAVMAQPGSTWIQLLEKRYNIKLNIVTMNFGLAQFMADKNFIQQCFITNEPYYVRKNGANPRTLLLADSGFDPYRVIYTSRKFAREHPEAVRAFVAGSNEGWKQFLAGDNAAARALIRAHNDKMEEDFMSFTIASLNENRLVAGYPEKGESIGALSPQRLEEQVAQLAEIGLLAPKTPVDKFAALEFLAAP